MSPEAARDPADPGLQQERTVLAWRRTTISFLIVGLLIARAALSAAQILALAGIVLLAPALWLVVETLRDRGRTAGEEQGFRLLRDGRLPAGAALVCAGLCLLVLLLGWL